MDVEVNILSLVILIVILILVFTVTNMAVKMIQKKFSAIEKKPKKRPVGFK